MIVDLGDENNPENCDAHVGGEKQIETHREKTVQQASNQWRLQSNYQSTQHANVRSVTDEVDGCYQEETKVGQYVSLDVQYTGVVPVE